MSALLGFASGFAKAVGAGALKEDERRAELSKEAYVEAMKRRDMALKLATEQQEEFKKQTDFINTVSKMNIDGSPVSRAEAYKLYELTTGDVSKVNDVVKDGFIKIANKGTLEVTQGAGWSAATAVPEMSGAEEESSFLFGSRTKAVSDMTKQRMAGVGDVAGASKYSVSGTEGGKMSTAETQDPQVDLMYIQGSSTVEGGMVERRSVVVDGKPQVKFYKIDGTEVTEQVSKDLASGNASLSKSAGSMKTALAFTFNKDGTVGAKPQGVLIDEQGRFFTEDGSGKRNRITGENMLILPASAVGDMGGVDAVEKAFDALGKDGRLAYKEYQTSAEGIEGFLTIADTQMELLNKHGDKLVSDLGNISDLATYIKTEFGVALEFIDGRADLTRAYEKAMTYLSTADGNDLSTARKVFAANQVVLAYQFAKATGDPRISNADFDQFSKTISAGNVDAQVALYRDRLKQALSHVESKWTTVESYAMGDRAKAVLDSMPESRTLQFISGKVDETFSKLPEEKAALQAPVGTVERTTYNGKTAFVVRLPDGSVYNDAYFTSEAEAERYMKRMGGQ